MLDTSSQILFRGLYGIPIQTKLDIDGAYYDSWYSKLKAMSSAKDKGIICKLKKGDTMQQWEVDRVRYVAGHSRLLNFLSPEELKYAKRVKCYRWSILGELLADNSRTIGIDSGEELLYMLRRSKESYGVMEELCKIIPKERVVDALAKYTLRELVIASDGKSNLGRRVNGAKIKIGDTVYYARYSPKEKDGGVA